MVPLWSDLKDLIVIAISENSMKVHMMCGPKSYITKHFKVQSICLSKIELLHIVNTQKF